MQITKMEGKTNLENDSSNFVLQTQPKEKDLLPLQTVDEDIVLKTIESLRPICGSPSDKVFCLACEHVHSHYGACHTSD